MDYNTLRSWYDAGFEKGATHLLIVDHLRTRTVYPVWVYPNDSVLSKIAIYDKYPSMVLEMYSYEGSLESQFRAKENRVRYGDS